MKRRELNNIGIYERDHLKAAQLACREARAAGMSKVELRAKIQEVVADPDQFTGDSLFGVLADLLSSPEQVVQNYEYNEELQYECWGEEIDPAAHEQMENACRLPISFAGALMPDAHLGYGLPIGGVLATKNAVIPYAVGVDIACRVKLTVLDIPVTKFNKNKGRFAKAIEEETRFGMGATFKKRRQHEVMDEDWGITPLTGGLKDKAWSQLGTSGSGNHFVEFGEINFNEDHDNVKAGAYLGLVSHSGSRGAGAQTANHYSKLAMSKHPGLPKYLRHLAWLDMDEDGAEYWAAMELMGRYASASHALIHDHICSTLGAQKMYQVENHHNFAWIEHHHGEEVIVHRKGATPAGAGELGYVPGSMTAPGYLVEGLGNPLSLHSCSHGAGRQMSRKQAKNTTTYHELKKVLADNKVELLSAGLDESPHAYKDIEQVMRAQKSLVRTIARFQPRLVKMAPAGERPED